MNGIRKVWNLLKYLLNSTHPTAIAKQPMKQATVCPKAMPIAAHELPLPKVLPNATKHLPTFGRVFAFL
jgi:hypothetical protein